jgi:hypothetical protein
MVFVMLAGGSPRSAEKRIGESQNAIAGHSSQSVLPDDVANADRKADTGNDDHVHLAPPPS